MEEESDVDEIDLIDYCNSGFTGTKPNAASPFASASPVLGDTGDVRRPTTSFGAV